MATISLPASAQQKKARLKPNIILIVADDLGYGNLTSFNANSKIPTPNIDQLATEGTRFTRFYAGNTVCAPSRCALMTGQTMGHAYVRGNGNVSLRPQDTTVAQRLQANGYATGMFGKWGLGDENKPGSPQLKGFESFFGYINQTHAHDYFTGHLFEIKKGQVNRITIDTTQYSHDLIMDHALAFVKENTDKPFFLYLPVTIPHAELRVPDSLLQPFLNADGSSRFEPETPFAQKANYGTQLKPRATFAAMMTKLDTDVGRVLKLVKDLGLDDNTYIFFTSDNGPHKEGGGDPDYFNSSGRLRGIKRDLYEGGIRVPMLVKAPGKVPAGKTSDIAWAFWDEIGRAHV
jgi:arylsulfatase A-like enzyme